MKRTIIGGMMIMAVLLTLMTGCSDTENIPADSAEDESMLLGVGSNDETEAKTDEANEATVAKADIADESTVEVPDEEIPDVPEGDKLTEAEDEVQPTLEADDQEAEEVTLPLNAADTGEEVTPYQFLYLILGNAQELSFDVTVTDTQNGRTEVRSFQRQGDRSVACFTAEDMNGNMVEVRELEQDGKVYYIMDGLLSIRTYLAPASDYILYRMTEAAKTAPDSALSEDDYMVYEHSLPFQEDESLLYRYRFYMKEDVLKKLTVTFGEGEPTIYEFSEFRQEIMDPEAFDLPEDYWETIIEDTYNGEHMPPWWEIGNDA